MKIDKKIDKNKRIKREAVAKAFNVPQDLIDKIACRETLGSIARVYEVSAQQALFAWLQSFREPPGRMTMTPAELKVAFQLRKAAVGSLARSYLPAFAAMMRVADWETWWLLKNAYMAGWIK